MPPENQHMYQYPESAGGLRWITPCGQSGVSASGMAFDFPCIPHHARKHKPTFQQT